MEGDAPSGVRGLAHQVRSQAAGQLARGVTRLQDEVSGQGYERFDDGGDGGEEEGGERWTPNQDPSQVDEDARSDATEGHDEEGGEERGYQMASDTGPAPQAPPPGPPLEAALEASGHGAAQWRLLAALGPAVAADGAERLLVWLALPSAERELCGRDAKGWLCESRRAGAVWEGRQGLAL
ncbi:synaptic vesicle glycoprotein 2A-like [Lampetra fluviatilis]